MEFKRKPAGTKVLQVVKMLGMDMVIVRGQGRLSRPWRGKGKIYSNNNLLKDSRGKRQVIA